MFFKNSRYRKQPVAITIDARGRRFKSVTLRNTPEAGGTFLHTLKEGDRPDHLAYRYYKAPRKWWRIADADADFFSPLDLFGSGVIKKVRIPLTLDDEEGETPWSRLSAGLALLVGVDSYWFEEIVLLAEDTRTVAGEVIPVAIESYERSVIINYNSLNIKEADLTAVINASGFIAGQAENIGRIGRQIIIPPDAPA